MKTLLLALLVVAVPPAVGCQGPRPSEPPDLPPMPRPMAHVDGPPGGETTEFPGAQPVPCSQVAARTPRALTDPQVSAWAAALDGRHELPLAWRPTFLGVASGFEAHTSIVLDIRTVGASDVRWQANSCSDPRTLHLELEIDLALSDGSLSGTVQHVMSALPGGEPDGHLELSSPWQWPVDVVPLLQTLDLGQGDLTGRRAELSLSLALVAGQLRGDFNIWVEGDYAESDERHGAGTPVIDAAFPDDGCPTSTDPQPMAAPLEAHEGASAQALFETAADMLRAAPYPAHWRESWAGPDLATTSASFQIEAGQWVCVQGPLARVPVTLSLSTTDDKLDLQLPATLSLVPATDGRQHQLTLQSPYIPSVDFEGVTGIDDADLTASDYGRVEMEVMLDPEQGTLSGQLYLDRWRDGDPQDANYPRLIWPRP